MSLERRKPLKRTGGPKRTGPPKRRTRLKPVSDKRKKQLPARAKVRDIVRARDRGCVARDMPDVPCGQIGGRASLEVHEIRGGADRHATFLDPDFCVAVCPKTHDWIGENVAEAKRRGLLAAVKTETARHEAERRRRTFSADP